MKKLARYGAYIIGGLTVLGFIALGALYFGIPMLGEHEFRKDFAKVQPYYICRTDSERALSLGGYSGLSRLRRLSNDASIAPVGRKVAAHLIDYIQAKQHISDLKKERIIFGRPEFPNTLYDYYACFIIWKDEN